MKKWALYEPPEMHRAEAQELEVWRGGNAIGKSRVPYGPPLPRHCVRGYAMKTNVTRTARTSIEIDGASEAAGEIQVGRTAIVGVMLKSASSPNRIEHAQAMTTT